MQQTPGIIFDLDGTLADTLSDIATTLNHTIGKLGRPPLTIDRVRELVGDGLSTLISRASGENDPETVDALIVEFRAFYADHLLDQTELYAGWAEVLDKLAEWGIPLAVLSNKPHDFTRNICAELLERWPLVHVEGQRREYALKPDPGRALAICDMMNRSPEDVYFVGDSEVDVQTALRGRLCPIAVSWGFRDRQTLLDARAEVFIESPSELLPLIHRDLDRRAPARD